MLVICCVALAASLALRVRADGQVGVGGHSRLTLPPMCFSRTAFDIPCPGCGLTRSFVHLAHLEWDAAWRMHRLGWLLFATVLLQLPYRLHAVITRRQIVPVAVATWYSRTLIALLIGNWLWTMCS